MTAPSRNHDCAKGGRRSAREPTVTKVQWGLAPDAMSCAYLQGADQTLGRRLEAAFDVRHAPHAGHSPSSAAVWAAAEQGADRPVQLCGRRCAVPACSAGAISLLRGCCQAAQRDRRRRWCGAAAELVAIACHALDEHLNVHRSLHHRHVTAIISLPRPSS